MKARLLSISFVFLLFSPAFSQEKQRDLERSFKAYSLTRLDTRGLSAGAREEGSISISAGSSEFELRLAPRELRASNYRAEDTTAAGVRQMPRAPLTTYKGTVAGDPGSRVRLTIDDSKIEGYFLTAGEMFFIEPASDYSKLAKPDEFVVYRLSDVLSDRSFVCNSELLKDIQDGRRLVDSQAGSFSLAQNAVEIATEADFDFVQTNANAAGANAKILSILNMTEGLFEAELNLTVLVTFQHTFSTPDNYNGANSDSLLVSFRDAWNTSYPTSQYPRDTAHLFTYKPNVRAQGYAYIGVICNNPNFAYGLSGRVDPSWGWEEANFLVTSHEIAHNLGANHSDTYSSCNNTLMQSALSGNTALSFCTPSRNEVGSFVGANGSCLTPARGSVPFDFDGDRKSDLAIFRPSNGVWYIANSGSPSFNVFQFGANGDVPVAGDYDGDGKADAAVYRSGVWWRLKSANSTVDAVNFGVQTDLPAPADFDGDGKADVAVFRPSTGYWHRLRSSDGGYSPVQFGLAGDLPAPADFDGDGSADVNVFRPSTGVWYRTNSATGSFFAEQFGANGDRPVPGDFDGDGKADIAVFRGSNGGWYAHRSSDGGYLGTIFGMLGDVPVAADYDGDGRSDYAVWRPSTGVWHRLNSSNGLYFAYQFGVSTDLAVSGR